MAQTGDKKIRTGHFGKNRVGMSNWRRWVPVIHFLSSIFLSKKCATHFVSPRLNHECEKVCSSSVIPESLSSTSTAAGNRSPAGMCAAKRSSWGTLSHKSVAREIRDHVITALPAGFPARCGTSVLEYHTFACTAPSDRSRDRTCREGKIDKNMGDKKIKTGRLGNNQVGISHGRWRAFSECILCPPSFCQ